MTRAAADTDRVRALLDQRIKAARKGTPHGTSPGIGRRPDPDRPAPLSGVQARLWFLSQLEPGSATYNIPFVLRLGGALDVTALAEVVTDLAERHEVLRSVVAETADGPVAVVRPAAEVPVTVTDLTDRPDPRGELEARLAAAATRPFALDREVPLRAECVRLAGDEHVLALTVHHIAADGWSYALLVDDLAALYAARLGVGPTPPPPALQYADVAAWERANGADTAAVDWWAQRLSGLPPLLDLPTDRPRTQASDWPAGTVPVDLPAALAGRVLSVGREHGCTPFMVLLAGLQALLARLGGTEDVAVGVPEAGRRHRDTERMIGCFVNTLVLRGDLSGDPTGRDLLVRTRDAALEAFSHGQAPFDRVVDRIGPQRTLGATPLYQVTLNVQDAPRTTARFPGVEVSAGEGLIGTAKTDLTLALTTSGADLAGSLIYRADLFDRETAERFVRWYLRVLDGLLADLARPVAAIEMEPAPEPETRPAREFPRTEPLHALIERQVDAHPDAVAVTGPDGRVTYAELDRRANRIARHLLAGGVRPEEPVGIRAESGVALAAAFLGVLKAGACYVPLDPAYPRDRVEAVRVAAGIRVILTEDGIGSALGSALPDTRPDVPVAPDHLAYVVFTSGSTGTPKGVAVEHRQITQYLHSVLDLLGPLASGTFALISTFAADLGLTNVLGALGTGGTLRMVGRETATDPEAFARFLAREPVDVIKCVPSHLELLAAHGDPADLAAVLPRKLLILAGEPCPWSLVDQIRAARPDLAVQVHYGPTETTVSVLAYDTADDTAGQRTGIVPLGRPLPGVVARVVDPAGRPLPRGLPGELVIGGPSVARGYLGRPDLTAERFGPSGPSTPGGLERESAADAPSGKGVGGLGPQMAPTTEYRSGDRVRVRRDGAIEFLGRLDDQVKIRGYRVEPLEVAAALRACPGVAEAVVLPVGEAHRRRLAAWLVPDPGAELDPSAVRAAARAVLPDYMVPAGFAVLDALPLTPNGKVDRAALPAPQERAGSRPPQSPAERAVAAAWCQVLDLPEVGAEDDFFALGGDSFRALRAVRAIDPGLRVIELFTHPTVRELAEFLDRQEGAGGDPGRLLHHLAGPAQGTVTVVCVPYGGGSAAAYQPLARELARAHPGARVMAVELPGHDPSRPDEALLPMDDLVERCAAELDGIGPVLVYGHCVGTAIAFALARRLEDGGADLAGVVLGGNFPNARLPGRLSAMVNRLVPTDRWVNDRAYRDLLKVAGGLADELGTAEDEAATEAMMRSLRHDVRLAEAWFSQALGEPGPRLRAPVLCVIGERDRATELYQERYLEWAELAERVELITIPRAGHYFLKHQAGQVADLIAEHQRAWAAGRPPVTQTQADQRGGLRAFYLVAGGQLVSMVGTALSTFALGVWAFQESGRALDYALVTMLAFLPAILAAPLGGAVADRYDRRSVMLVCDAASGLAMLALVVLYATGRLALWHVCVIVWTASLVQAFHRPAYLAAIAQLVPKPYLPQANALAQLGLGVGTLIAPLAGGALITLVGLSWVLAIDVVTFAVGLATLLAVKFPNRLFRRREETFRQAIVGGWRFIARRRPLVVMIVFFVVENYLSLIPLAVLAPLMLAVGDPADLGLVTAAGGLGAAVGALVMVVWGGTQRRAVGMVGFVIGVGAGIAAMGVHPSTLVVGCGIFAWWMSTSILNAHWLSIIQVKVGTELQGRVLATNQMMAVSMTPVTFLSAPLFAEHGFEPLMDRGGTLAGSVGHVIGTGPGRGVALMLVLAGALLVAWGVLGLLYRPLRRMEDDLPDAVLGAEISRNLDEVQAEADLALAGRGP